jgi:hypothetical protein
MIGCKNRLCNPGSLGEPSWRKDAGGLGTTLEVDLNMQVNEKDEK